MKLGITDKLPHANDTMTEMRDRPLWHEGKDVNDLIDNLDDQYAFELAANLWEDILCLKEDRLSNRQLADFINELTLTAREFHEQQNLREHIAKVVKRTLKWT